MSAEKAPAAGAAAATETAPGPRALRPPWTRHLAGLALAGAVAVGAAALEAVSGAPAMLVALIAGMAFNRVAEAPAMRPGLDLAARTVLRIGVALLGLRLSLGDLAALGPGPPLAVAGLVVATIGAGAALSAALGRGWRFGVVTGGSVAICGASAALALASVLGRTRLAEREVLFTVAAVTALSTGAMLLYPALFAALGFDARTSGLLIGATIHDVAQVVGAGYAVSEQAGDTAVLVKLQRVALLPVVLLGLLLALGGRGGAGAVRLPGFLIGFLALAAATSLGLVPEPVRAAAVAASGAMLLTAVAALGVRTSLRGLTALGAGGAGLVLAETALLLALATGLVALAGG